MSSLKIEVMNGHKNAYRTLQWSPLQGVGRLPGGVCQEGVSAQRGCLPIGGVSDQGVCLTRGCLPGGVCLEDVSRGCLPKGVSAWGCLPRGGVCPWGCLPGGCLLGGVCPRSVSQHTLARGRGVCLVGYLPRGFLPWGLSDQGVSAQGCLPKGYFCPGGVCQGGVSWGVSAKGVCLTTGVSALRGVYPGGVCLDGVYPEGCLPRGGVYPEGDCRGVHPLDPKETSPPLTHTHTHILPCKQNDSHV